MLSEVLKREKLFSLLYKIDVDLAEKARIQGCPFVGGRYIKQAIAASLVVVPRICVKNIWYA